MQSPCKTYYIINIITVFCWESLFFNFFFHFKCLTIFWLFKILKLNFLVTDDWFTIIINNYAPLTRRHTRFCARYKCVTLHYITCMVKLSSCFKHLHVFLHLSYLFQNASSILMIFQAVTVACILCPLEGWGWQQPNVWYSAIQHEQWT